MLAVLPVILLLFTMKVFGQNNRIEHNDKALFLNGANVAW